MKGKKNKLFMTRPLSFRHFFLVCVPQNNLLNHRTCLGENGSPLANFSVNDRTSEINQSQEDHTQQTLPIPLALVFFSLNELHAYLSQGGCGRRGGLMVSARLRIERSGFEPPRCRNGYRRI